MSSEISHEEYWRLRPNAPTIGTSLGPIGQIQNNEALEFTFGRGRSAFSMFVVRRDPAVYGYLNICPHASLPLNYRAGEFLNESRDRIRCTMHFAEFRVEDGFGVAGAAENCRLNPIPVICRDNELFIGQIPFREED